MAESLRGSSLHSALGRSDFWA